MLGEPIGPIYIKDICLEVERAETGCAKACLPQGCSQKPNQNACVGVGVGNHFILKKNWCLSEGSQSLCCYRDSEIHLHKSASQNAAQFGARVCENAPIHPGPKLGTLGR